jgi:hypothetical protein
MSTFLLLGTGFTTLFFASLLSGHSAATARRSTAR